MTTIQTLRIATRKSPLALRQTHSIAEIIKKAYPNLAIEFIPLVTSGDRFQERPLPVDNKGLFVKELEEALLNGTADIAVHSMKDVPATLPKGLCIAIINQRHNPFDALISNNHQSLRDLPKNAVIGTVSLRRQSQLLAIRPDLIIKPLRGNVGTRLQKLNQGEYDAIILAVAGLERLGHASIITEILSEDIMTPACGQGAIGIECRTDDLALQQYLSPVHDAISSLCVNAERHVNAQLGGSCRASLAVYCKPVNHQELSLRAKVLSPDGKTVIEATQQGLQSQAMSLANACVQAMTKQGAHQLLHMLP